MVTSLRRDLDSDVFGGEAEDLEIGASEPVLEPVGKGFEAFCFFFIFFDFLALILCFNIPNLAKALFSSSLCLKKLLKAS